MKKLYSAVIALCLLLSGCTGAESDPDPVVTQPTQTATVPVTVPATVPTEPAPEDDLPEIYTNPLNGEILDKPFSNRIFAVSVNNLEASLPHVGVVDADIYMEMYVNGSIIRSLALYSDIQNVKSIGSVRSTRLIFNDLAQRYDAFLVHAGGSTPVMTDVSQRGLDHRNIDTGDATDHSFRDFDRRDNGYAWEHCLFAKGEGIYNDAKAKGMAASENPGRDYGLTFTEDATPANGTDAGEITVKIATNEGASKKSILTYSADHGGYLRSQYGKTMTDGITGEPEIYQNVIVMLVKTTTTEDGYHQAEFTQAGTGDGYFACGGKMIPIRWQCDGDGQPFRFLTGDGQPLDLNVGRTYMAIAGLKSSVSCQ